jgi:hypothetical protein
MKCYVKDTLRPTRTLGDFRLKYEQFNDASCLPKSEQIKDFSGPYISVIN